MRSGSSEEAQTIRAPLLPLDSAAGFEQAELRHPPVRRRGLLLVCAAFLVAAGVMWARDYIWLRPLPLTPPLKMIPSWVVAGGQLDLTQPDRDLVAEVFTNDSEFIAFLMFGYLRTTRLLHDQEVLLTYRRVANSLKYTVEVHLPNALLSSVGILSRGREQGVIEGFSWQFVTRKALDRRRRETQLFQTAYNQPTRRKLEQLTRAELVSLMRRFMRFKSLTDPRIRGQIVPVPQALSSDQAHQLAEDIVTIADFYSLPLDFFLGIGAMENNYMNVDGDLHHAIWKRRAEEGDVVLKHGRKGVLVVNSSSGVWQITRQTLRYAHSLYLRDQRDYSRLPARLKPSEVLDVNNVDPASLTTYAGLLLRDLLDRCSGDADRALGAYNGGLGRPNARYAEGVRVVAGYARRVMEQAAVLNGSALTEPFLVRSR